MQSGMLAHKKSPLNPIWKKMLYLISIEGHPNYPETKLQNERSIFAVKLNIQGGPFGPWPCYRLLFNICLEIIELL